MSSTKVGFSSTLTSLAMLRVNADYGTNYMDYFSPMISHSISKRKLVEVSIDDAKKIIHEDFGLIIPLHAVERILNRLQKKTKKLERKDGVYHILSPIETVGVEAEIAAARREQKVIINSLIEYSKNKFSVDLNRGDAESAVVAFLHDFSMECLAAFEKGSALPEAPNKEDFKYIVSSYVAHIQNNSISEFEAFIKIVKGSMLTNSVLCEDLASMQRDYSQVTFYLDTPFVMRLFGFWGKSARDAAVELLGLLRALNGKLAIFNHILEESIAVTKNAAKALEDPSQSNHGMVRSLRKENYRVHALTAMIHDMGSILDGHSVKAVSAPPYIAKYNISHTDLSGVIEEEIHYYNEKALDNDINSIRSIYALRKNGAARKIEDCVAIMITSNKGLVTAAEKYAKNFESALQQAAVIDDYTLANSAWLKSPVKAGDIPRLELMAHCYAALKPDKPIWDKYLKEAESLLKEGSITADQHALLRLHNAAEDDLMEVTLGGSLISRDSVRSVLDRIENRLIKDEQEKTAAVNAEKEQKDKSAKDNIDYANRIKGHYGQILIDEGIRIRRLAFSLLLVIYAAIFLLLRDFTIDTLIPLDDLNAIIPINIITIITSLIVPPILEACGVDMMWIPKLIEKWHVDRRLLEFNEKTSSK